jgi:hypothetical protein
MITTLAEHLKKIVLEEEIKLKDPAQEVTCDYLTPDRAAYAPRGRDERIAHDEARTGRRTSRSRSRLRISLE